jgi:molybdopterin-guanine dinucleotide biosynthesis protein A
MGDRNLLDHLFAALRPQVDEIIIVAENPIAYLAWDALIIKPHALQPGCLDRLYAGLFACRQPYALVTTCDRPFIQQGVVHTLLASHEPKWDAVLPRSSVGGPEPLPALYSKRSMALLRKCLETGPCDLMVFLDRIRIKMIDEAELRVHDPEMISWLNVHLPAESARAQNWLRRSEAWET